MKIASSWGAGVGMALAALLILHSAQADSWLRPEPRTYVSRDSTFRLTVIPRGYGWSSKTSTGPVPDCQATLEQLHGRSYVQLWRKPLVNREAPQSVLVAGKSGRFVTFDDAGGMGYGNNVVVIYAPDGQLVRRLALSDFLTPEEIEALPRSVSSILWGGEHRLSADEDYVELGVASGGSKWHPFASKYRRVRIRLVDGSVE